MAIYGPRLADNDAAQAYLADMSNRPSFLVEAVDGALDRLAELPLAHRWIPSDGAEWRACVEVYTRGALACGLVVDRARCSADFYTGADFAVRGQRYEFVAGWPSEVLLLRVMDALTAARVVYPVLAGAPVELGTLHPGHGAELGRLWWAAHDVTTARLTVSREGVDL